MTNYESNSFHVIDEEQDTSAAFSTLPPSEAHGDAAMKLWHSTTLPDGQSINVSVCFTPDDIKGLQSYLNDQFGGRRGFANGGQLPADAGTLEFYPHEPPYRLPKVGDTVHVVTAQVTGHQPDVDLFVEQSKAIAAEEAGVHQCAVIYNGVRCGYAEHDQSIPHSFQATPVGFDGYQTGDGAATPPAFAPTVTATANAGEQQAAESATGAGTPAVAPSPSAPAEKIKRPRRKKVEKAYDDALQAYNADPTAEKNAVFQQAVAELRAKDPGNDRLAESTELQQVPEGQPGSAPGPSFAPEAQTAANYLAQEQSPINQQFAEWAGNLPGEHLDGDVVMTPEQYATVPAFQPGQAQQLGQVSVTPEEYGAAAAFPCPHQSSDGRTCVRPYGHEIQTAANPEPKPHVYATVPSQLPGTPVTTGADLQRLAQPVPDPLPWTPPLPVAEPVNEHSPFQGPPPAGPLSFQVPPTPAAVPAPEPTGAVHQPPAPAAPFWQQPNGGQQG